MSRASRDVLAEDGSVLHGFDYQLQVWIDDGVVMPCGHPARMRARGSCCNQDRWQGLAVASLPGHERRLADPQQVRTAVKATVRGMEG